MNPTFLVEAITATRRPRIYWLRALYGGLLFVVLLSCASGLNFGSTDYASLRERLAQFAATFFTTFTWVQTLGVLVVCPAIFAGAIAGDRERGVLDHILTTDLSSREIVLGKLVARLIEAFHLVAVAFPILAMVMLLGGIRDDVLTMSVVVTGALILSIAGASIYISTTTPKSRDAVTRVYLVGALAFVLVPMFVAMVEGLAPGVFSVPPVGLAWLFAALHPLGLLTSALAATVTGLPPPWENVWAFVAVHCTVFLAGTLAAIWSLRRVQIGPSARAMRRRTSRGLLDWLRPYLERDPVLWKDLTLEHAARWGGRLGMAAGWLVVVCVLIGAGHVFVTAPVGESYFLRDGFYLYTSTVNVALACVAVLAVAIRASCAVTSEAEKDTLVVLMSTPLKAETIVWSKLLASLYGARALVALMLFNAGLSVIRTPVAMIAHAGALLQLLVMSLAVGAMAIWISATAKSSVTAIIKTVLLCTVIGGGYLFCGMCCLLGGPSTDAYSMILAPCVPYLLGMPYFWFDLGQYGGQWFIAPYVCGTVAYLVIGLGAYHAAADELDRRCRGNANIFNS